MSEPTSSQAVFRRRGNAVSQNAAILACLMESPGAWVSVLRLQQVSHSIAVHSRIADLRARGHSIANRTERPAGICHSFYRLLPPQTQDPITQTP